MGVEAVRYPPRYADQKSAPEPVLITSGRDKTVAPIHVFTIGRKKHFMPAEPPGNLRLRCLDASAAGASDAEVQVMILRTMLGDASYEALLECEHVTRDQLNRIMRRVVDHALPEVPVG